MKTCTHKIKKGTTTVICGARHRLNYPHGRNSRGVSTFETEHQKGCKHRR